MVNTIWKENFLIMCSKLCLNARDSGHFAQLLLICRNYSLQTLCGAPHNVCNDNGLTPQQMKRYEELYHDPQLFFLLGKTLCVEHTTPEEYARVMAPPPKTKESPER